MNICKECGWVFEDEETVVMYDDPSPAGVSLTSGSYKSYFCPHCGSDYIEEATQCELCGEWHAGYSDYCDECEEKVEKAIEKLAEDMDFDCDKLVEAITQIC